jgi:hypothetical protein
LVTRKCASANAATLGTPTDTQGNTLTLIISIVFAGDCSVYIWVGTAKNNTAMTVSHNMTGSALPYSAVTEVWHYAALDLGGTPAGGGGGGSLVGGTVATTKANSVITWCGGDTNALNPASRTYRTTDGTPVEEYIVYEPGVYTAYYAYQPAVVVQANTFQVTAPVAQHASAVGVEILDNPNAGITSVQDQNKFSRFPWQ